MKIREQLDHWDQDAKGELTRQTYRIPLDMEAAARLCALHDLYPKRSQEELLAELVAAALEDLEASFPYVPGDEVLTTDELGDPIYADVGQTPDFLARAREHLARLKAGQPDE